MIDDALSRRIIVYAAVCGASGVALGAFGAHGLETVLEAHEYDQTLIPKRLEQFATGVRYQLTHAVAMLALAASPFGAPAIRRWVGRLFLIGVVLFSGSLYGLVLSNRTEFGMVAPFGALCWIGGWLMLMMLALRSAKGRESEQREKRR